MPEEIQIRDADGSESASEASVGEAVQPSTETTLSALGAQPERLSMDELNEREARFGARKPMGPLLAESPLEAPLAAIAEEVSPIDPLPLEEE